MLLRIIPFMLAALLLAAHFFRYGNLIAALLCVLAPLLFLIKQRWSLIALQVFSYAGALIWLLTTVDILRQRLMVGLPWSRLVVILGVVILFTVWAGLLLNSRPVKEKYPVE